MLNQRPVFLKLGGSLITDKSQPRTVRREILARLSHEIAGVRETTPGLKLVLGHGSGSFGHMTASLYRTRDGVAGERAWSGFTEVWQVARELNTVVMSALYQAGVPAIAFPPSAAAIANNGKVFAWETRPLQLALDAGLLPVIYGDVVFDRVRGGTIISTEELFAHLASTLSPQRILLAGSEPGVWLDYPLCTHLAEVITPEDLPELSSSLKGSANTDVTGGMLAKVELAVNLVQTLPELEVIIFSGLEAGLLGRALSTDPPGTHIRRPSIDRSSHLD
jgi:isopentenyl phosphate kinase